VAQYRRKSNQVAQKRQPKLPIARYNVTVKQALLNSPAILPTIVV
jgi:hypothetical protein